MTAISPLNPLGMKRSVSLGLSDDIKRLFYESRTAPIRQPLSSFLDGSSPHVTIPLPSNFSISSKGTPDAGASVIHVSWKL